MSQEINLINPALLPRRDWLVFNNLAVAVAFSLLAMGGLYAWVRISADASRSELQAASGQRDGLKKTLQEKQDLLAARKSDPLLEQETQRLGFSVRQGRELRRLATESASGEGASEVAAVMRGFSRQTLSGVWLTGFGVGPGGFEIRGRLLDPSLLPTYIRKLNEEPDFRGRRFAALDMRAGGLEPASPGTPASSGTAPQQPSGGAGDFVEFMLKASKPAAVSASTAVSAPAHETQGEKK